MKQYDIKDRVMLILQMVLTTLGLVMALVTVVQTLAGPKTFLGVLSPVMLLIAYLAVTQYAALGYKREDTSHFRWATLAYAALLGIQTLQSGNMIANYGLPETLTTMINICNLTAFACVIVFTERMDRKKHAIIYLATAVVLKFAGELALNISLWYLVNFRVFAMSMSVPVLGFTILCAYLSRCRRLSDEAVS